MSGSTTVGVIATMLYVPTASLISDCCPVDSAVAPVGFAEIKTFPNCGVE